jgi:hypothetical protein
MTCHASRANFDPPLDPETEATYLDLVRAHRHDDFRWLARSHGVPPERLDALWRRLLVRLQEEAAAGSNR